MAKIRVIVKRPEDETGFERYIEDNLDAIEEIVGGETIEYHPIPGIVIFTKYKNKLERTGYCGTLFDLQGPDLYGAAVVTGIGVRHTCGLPEGFTIGKWSAWIGELGQREQAENLLEYLKEHRILHRVENREKLGGIRTYIQIQKADGTPAITAVLEPYNRGFDYGLLVVTEYREEIRGHKYMVAEDVIRLIREAGIE